LNGTPQAAGYVSSGETGRFLRPRAIEARARALLEEFDVRPADPSLPISALSAGNQQKVVLARQLASHPRVVVASNPSRGIDVGATESVHKRLLRAREEGSAVLLVSNDLDELFDLSDRVIALYRGEIAYEARSSDVSLDELALAMAGTHRRVRVTINKQQAEVLDRMVARGEHGDGRAAVIRKGLLQFARDEARRRKQEGGEASRG
jgi:ABC-type multidrug transport system ATPase subunit